MKSDKVSRIVKILMALQSGKAYSTGELSKLFGTSKRTIFRDLKERRNMSILFITHDLGTVAGIADRIVVMYGGRITEAGTALDIFNRPKHPYTYGLLNCLPDISTRRDRLTPIPGVIPSLIDPPEGCIFNPRCERRMPICNQERPEEIVVSGEHLVACHLYSKPAHVGRVS